MMRFLFIAAVLTFDSAFGSPFKWVGTSESCAEFGTNVPGTYNYDYTFPANTSIDTLVSDGLNIFRIPVLMERLSPNGLTASFDEAYLGHLKQTIQHVTKVNGASAIIDLHNYGRYYNNIITDIQGFQSFWKTLAGHFKGNRLVIFDTNNEYHDMDQTLVLNLNQGAINGIRNSGATSQYIFVEGNGYSGAASWNTTNDNLKTLTDPSNKIVYEMHLYLNTDYSGGTPTCVSPEVGVQRAEGATAWLRTNQKIGFMGETAGGPNSVCKKAVRRLLNHLKANNDVWMGFSWWAAGPWWGDYYFSLEPPSGTAYTYYISMLKTYT